MLPAPVPTRDPDGACHVSPTGFTRNGRHLGACSAGALTRTRIALGGTLAHMICDWSSGWGGRRRRVSADAVYCESTCSCACTCACACAAVSYSFDEHPRYSLQLWRLGITSPGRLVLECELPLFTHADLRTELGTRLAFGGPQPPAQARTTPCATCFVRRYGACHTHMHWLLAARCPCMAQLLLIVLHK